MELLSDVLETGSSIQADRTQQVETGTGRKTANCGFHCTKFYENSFILKNSGNHQHRKLQKAWYQSWLSHFAESSGETFGERLQRYVTWANWTQYCPCCHFCCCFWTTIIIQLYLEHPCTWGGIMLKQKWHGLHFAFCTLWLQDTWWVVGELHNETEIKPGARTTCVLWTLERPSIKMSIAQRFTIL